MNRTYNAMILMRPRNPISSLLLSIRQPGGQVPSFWVGNNGKTVALGQGGSPGGVAGGGGHNM